MSDPELHPDDLQPYRARETHLGPYGSTFYQYFRNQEEHTEHANWLADCYGKNIVLSPLEPNPAFQS